MKRIGIPLLLGGLLCGALFFSQLGELWPLLDMDLNADRSALRQQAREFLVERGFDLEGFDSSARLRVDSPAVEYLERTFGREAAQQRLRDGFPLAYYEVSFKRRILPDEPPPGTYRVSVLPHAGVLQWSRSLQEDEPGPRIEAEQARELAVAALEQGLGQQAADWNEISATLTDLPERRDHRFTFERLLSEEPELRERAWVTVGGDRVTYAGRGLVVPRAAARQRVADQEPYAVLGTLGYGLVAVAVLGAFFVFIRRLRDGTIKLRRAALFPIIAFACYMLNRALDTPALFVNWQPLWSYAGASFQYLVFQGMFNIWIVPAMLAVIAAGDVLDRELGAGRGRSLWILARGRLWDPAVGLASLRGFLIGMFCGGAMAAALLLLQQVGARTDLQPRGFFFFAINSSSPALATLLFFLMVALMEELGYRFFGGSWFLKLSGRRWVAVLVPALIYGLSHTQLDFLPPAEPFWARALVLTLVGAVWGVAFLRYDALTVVLSHYTADLFIFNWTRLGSGEAGPTAVAVGTLLVPLIPALLWLGRSAFLGGDRSGNPAEETP